MRDFGKMKKGSNNLDPRGQFTDETKSSLFASMNEKYKGREFGDHDLKQVQESLKAEGKDHTDLKVVQEDMQDYANKTGGSAGGKVGEGDMAMAA